MSALTKPASHFVSPDETTFLPTGQDFLDGAVSFGIKSSGQLRSFGLAPVAIGQSAYVTNESAQTTWVGTVGPDGALIDMKVFAYRGVKVSRLTRAVTSTSPQVRSMWTIRH